MCSKRNRASEFGEFNQAAIDISGRLTAVMNRHKPGKTGVPGSNYSLPTIRMTKLLETSLRAGVRRLIG